MLGKIVWWTPETTQGLIAVTEHGIVRKFFLLQSRIARSPEVIKPGQYVRFVAVAPPPKPGHLPVALAVEVSDTPFADEPQASQVEGGAK